MAARAVCALLAALALAAASPALVSAAELRLSLPRPTGPLAVGVHDTFISDPARIDPATGRPRTLPVRVWYPSWRPHRGHPAPYTPPAVEAIVEQALGLPPGSLDPPTHATLDAVPRRRARAVLLLSPGFGTLAALESAQAVDLASRGFVVVAFDHPHDSFAVQEPDGALITTDLGEDAAFPQRLLDVRIVLRHLAALVPLPLRGVRVGLFGHSMGGAAAAEAMRMQRRIAAGVDLDGTPRGPVVERGLRRPFGVMLSRRHTRASDIFLARFLDHLRGPHAVRRLPVEHYGYTDFAVFNAEARAADPALGAQLEAQLTTGVRSLAQGRRMVAIERRFLARAFGRWLRPSP
jgi:alpha-beta hydrolase superfamily lysophospholipase